MTFWFLSDLERLAIERQAIAALQEEADWLVGVDWSLNRGLQLDATIRLGERDFDVTLSYPDHFPFAPPIARPSVSDERWSSHQYPDGTLCLEWGPDTWHSDLTAADMLRSVQRLLVIERPDGEDRTAIAPSRHFLTTGQQLRGEYSRFCITASLRNFCGELPPGIHGTLELSLRIHRHCSTIILNSIAPQNASVWRDPELPAALDKSSLKGVFCKIAHTTMSPSVSNKSQLYDVLASCGLVISSDREGVIDSEPSFAMIIDSLGGLHAYWIGQGENDQVFTEHNVDFESTLDNARSSLNREALDDVRVGIVGLGSIGSKVAVSLARHGVRNYVLVDTDILCAENVIRHQLDWSDVGDHKADAVASAIERVVPRTTIKISKLHLTGQESNTALNGILRSLSNCGVVIDATGDDSVFNLLASVCSIGKLPMVWGIVFEGGFGGLVARSRPGKDPTPHAMRRLFLGYCEQNPFPQHPIATRYAGIIDGEVRVASDADVTSIATDLVSLAIDTVLDAEPSRYPHSLYLIGLSRGWVFEAPFHTIPISTTEHLDEPSPVNTSDETVKGSIEFIAGLLNRVDA